MNCVSGPEQQSVLHQLPETPAQCCGFLPVIHSFMLCLLHDDARRCGPDPSAPRGLSTRCADAELRYSGGFRRGSGPGKLDGVQGRGERRSDPVGGRREKSQEERGQGPMLEVVWRQESDIGAGKPRRRRMADDKEIELQNAARRVDLLRSALAEPTSQNHEVQVQVEQVEVGNRQPTIQGQQQSALGNRQQAGTRQHQAVQGQQQQRTPGFPSTAGNTVDQNMARAFPGLFKSGKSYTPSPKRRALRSTPIQFFLLNKCTERTPKSSDEMISYILMESYSKMVPLEGAWMLHKAAGGSGQRKLSVLAPEAEGYTGAYLAKALGGKGCLYIMPIQDTLDTSPLPYSSKEFENMPKARCATCHLSMPVQLLALHAQECEPSSCSDRMDLEPDLDPDLESPATSNPGNASPSVLPCRTSCSKIDIKSLELTMGLSGKNS
ncbi:hypothetical protein F7725_000073 [Dissostichus mawsoni]|uniref:Uncharacterized protein n=1 Tax=Dissostichus mawsoni TaxID=36200 RepID=A0A7J5ZHE0_DISMA|nr:hypothetical protein F7725_000073 [Dissostichus mawsoni]